MGEGLQRANAAARESRRKLVCVCDYCGGTFMAERSTARFCKPSHRVLFARHGIMVPKAGPPDVPATEQVSPPEDERARPGTAPAKAEQHASQPKSNKRGMGSPPAATRSVIVKARQFGKTQAMTEAAKASPIVFITGTTKTIPSAFASILAKLPSKRPFDPTKPQ